MKIAAAAALMGMTMFATAAMAQDLPNLEGKEVVVVTENAYPPLQFLDKSGAAVGWEYDAMAEIAPPWARVVPLGELQRPRLDGPVDLRDVWL